MSTILRQAARTAVRSRPFSSTAAARKDLVQDLYLKELKAYKPTPATQDAHVGLVKTFSAPIAPQAPALPSDLASELSAYDASEPTLAEVQAATTLSETEVAGGANAYLDFLEADLPKPEAHHH
ncbi:ATP synthase complex subunit H-domain-containing protein [Mucidula mucida]|nr:ATP synthase complex subunit H-domain-containing protein [Mucidula mucida]